MARYLLDTRALIEFSKGRQPTTSRILSMIESGDELGVSGVNVAEFYSGLPADQRAHWEEFFAALQYWDLTREVAQQAGAWRHDFARRGIQLSTTDVLIAATAQHQNAVVLTNNVRDFPMAEVQVEAKRD